MVPLARRALLYEVGDTKPRLILLPTRDEWDPACGSPAHTEDLDTLHWFSRKQQHSPIDTLPVGGARLANGYDIISLPSRYRRSSGRTPERINKTLLRMFSIEWPGNLIIVKRAQRHRGRVVHITPPEISLINSVVSR